MKKELKIILGSQSKGRKSVLEEMGIDFEVMPANIDEKAIRLNQPEQLVMAIAKAKTEVLKQRIKEPAILITADGVVVCDGEIREKPENFEEARRFLLSYKDKISKVVTGIVVTNLLTNKQVAETHTAIVHFKPFSENDIKKAVNSEGSMHLAGGFGLQGDFWQSHIKKIEGERSAVIGLSKNIIKKLLDDVIDE